MRSRWETGVANSLSTHAVTKRKGKDWPGHVMSRKIKWHPTEVRGWMLRGKGNTVKTTANEVA